MIDPKVTPAQLNKLNAGNMGEFLGIEFLEVGARHIKAKMPVRAQVHQPFGILHGGASVALAETLGSIAAYHCLDKEKQYAVGLDINANHIKAVRSGFVYGITTPIHVGKKTHVWQIRITDENDDLVCISRITMMIMDLKPKS